jgi:hypothetical protein
MIASASKVESGPVPTHLRVFASAASALWIAMVASGTSRALTAISNVSKSLKKSLTRARSATSCFVESRSLPVAWSTTWTPSLKLVKATRPASSAMSMTGSRPHSTTFAGAERIASSTTYGGIFTSPLSRSTVQPPSPKMSNASWCSTWTPVRSSTSSVARWMSSRSVSEKTESLRPALRSVPACRLRFNRFPPDDPPGSGRPLRRLEQGTRGSFERAHERTGRYQGIIQPAD